MKTVEQHAADIRKYLNRSHEYAVAIGKIEGAVYYPGPGATDADMLTNVKNILAALDRVLDEAKGTD